MSDDNRTKVKPPSTLSRIGSLACGSLLFWWLAYAASESADLPFAACLVVVVLGASVIMAVLTVFGVKAFEGAESLRRFNLSSLMLITVPLAIYLAGFRFLLSRAPTEEFTPGAWIALGVFALIAMAVVTILLVSMAEALLWAAQLPLTRRRGESQ